MLWRGGWRCQIQLCALLLTVSSLAEGHVIFTQKPEDTELSEGDTLNFLCEATLLGGNTEALPSYNWTKDGIFVGNSSMFTINSIRVINAGQYICTASIGGVSNSTAAIVTITPSEFSQTLVAVVVGCVMGSIGLLFLLAVLVCWLRACDKSGPELYINSLRRKSQTSTVEESLLELPTRPHRSKSMSHLMLTEHNFEDPYDRHLSHSTEQLLSGAENTIHPPEILDFDLQLDEKLFMKRTASDNNLREEQPPISILKQSSINGLKPPPRRPSEPLLSPHTSLASSAASDLGEDLSDTSSQFKSVRFELDHSGANQGSPVQTKRRFSAPDIKYVREPDKFAGECVELYSDTTTDEGLGSDHQLELLPDNKVANIVALISSGQSDSTNTREEGTPPINQGQVNEMKERFLKEVKVQEVKDDEPRQRVRSISKLVSETTRALMESKIEPSVTRPRPGKLIGLDHELGMLLALEDHSTEEYDSSKDEEMDKLEQARNSVLTLPYFGTPMSLWQPESGDSDDEDDDVMMVAPIKAASGLGSVSPFRKGVFGTKFMGLSIPMAREMFVRGTPPRTPSRKNSASRLSIIPEESPQGSAISLNNTTPH